MATINMRMRSGRRGIEAVINEPTQGNLGVNAANATQMAVEIASVSDYRRSFSGAILSVKAHNGLQRRHFRSIPATHPGQKKF